LTGTAPPSRQTTGRQPAIHRAGPLADGLFWLYAAFGAAGLLSLRGRLPETKDRTLEEIDRSLRGEAAT
jgi:hypothetical protein